MEIRQGGQVVGLIPACAGKTSGGVMGVRPLRAHPRVCGENGIKPKLHGQCRGSSPRVRGKLMVEAREPLLPGLIPACAGKTEAKF